MKRCDTAGPPRYLASRASRNAAHSLQQVIPGPVGAGLAREAADAVSQAHRVIFIASKRAPTETNEPVGAGLAREAVGAVSQAYLVIVLRGLVGMPPSRTQVR